MDMPGSNSIVYLVVQALWKREVGTVFDSLLVMRAILAVHIIAPHNPRNIVKVAIVPCFGCGIIHVHLSDARVRGGPHKAAAPCIPLPFLCVHLCCGDKRTVSHASNTTYSGRITAFVNLASVRQCLMLVASNWLGEVTPQHRRQISRGGPDGSAK